MPAKDLQITQDIEIAGFALYIRSQKTLVLSDLQFGYEEMMNKQGVMMPRINFRQIKKELEKIFMKLKKEGKKIEKIIVAGDLKHEFGIISEQEWKEVLAFFDLSKKHCKEIIVVKGNHDIVLGPIANWQNVRVEKEGVLLEKPKIYITHGHKIFENADYKKAKTLIIGHDHPTVSLREGVKSEVYKCFLKGKYKGKQIIVMPSFNFVSLGSNILQEKLLSPFLQGNLSKFEVWLLEDKPYYFGKLTNLQA